MNGFIDFEDKRIAYKDDGTGNAIVLLHGFTESMEIWNGFIPVLKEEFRVITIDLPGHGHSELLNGICTMDRMADAVKNVLDNLNAGKVILIGHSMGGYVSLAFARRFASMINGMVLFHSSAYADSEEAKKVRERTINVVRADHISFVTQFIPSLFAPQNIANHSEEIAILQHKAQMMEKEAIIASLNGMKNRENFSGLLEKIDFPVLFIAGKYDSRIPYELIKEQSKIPAESEFLLLENSGHMGYIEEKTLSLNRLRKFCQTIC